MNAFDPTSYWQNRLAQNPGLQGVGYIGLGRRYNEWLYRMRRQIFLREVRLLPLNWRESEVLDVGSGTGFYVQLWREIGAVSITGSDLTDVAVSRLQLEFREDKFIWLDIGASVSHSLHQRFDAISAFDVLFHIVDDCRYAAAISNIHTMLKDGGWFIFSDNFLRWTERADHQVSRSLGEVTSLLNQAGFQIVRRKPMFILMNYPIDTRHAIWRRLWGGLTYPVQRSECFGHALGAALYPLEVVLTGLLREGPSTELMICRKVPRSS